MEQQKQCDQPTATSSLVMVDSASPDAIAASSSSSNATTSMSVRSSAAATTSSLPTSHHQNAASENDSTSTQQQRQQQQQHLDLQSLDFIGTSHAVKGLFSLPYAPDKAISVGIHNLHGTLMIDADPTYCDENSRPNGGGFLSPSSSPYIIQQQKSEVGGFAFPEISRDGSNENSSTSNNDDSMTSIVAVPLQGSASSLQEEQQHHPTHSDALTILEGMIQDGRVNRTLSDPRKLVSKETVISNHPSSATLPHSENFATDDRETLSCCQSHTKESQQQIMPTGTIPKEPREYLQWAFHDMKLLIGSEALVYRTNSNNNAPSSASDTTTDNQNSTASLTVRVENVADLRRQLEQHQTMVNSRKFVPDHQLEKWEQTGRRSYAQALCTAMRHLVVAEGKEEDDDKTQEEMVMDGDNIGNSPSFAAPDLERVQLQTCIVPSSKTLSNGNMAAEDPIIPASATSPSSPVCTVLDAYLDNIMANVPQLALCLQEKGFVQSVKLINTEQIPSSFMKKATFDTSTPFEVIGNNSQQRQPGTCDEDIFSPKIMDMNASTLLRFLKENCTLDNATYLLRREAGQSNIQLYDVSAISKQRQRKWIWWLAMMSYRFSQRLRHMSLHLESSGEGLDCGAEAMKRTFRARQRSLLQNTLNLLEEITDMDGPSHETFIAECEEQLAETFLRSDDEVVMDDNESYEVKPAQQSPPLSGTHQRFSNITTDALNKAEDHLSQGIKALWRVWEKLADTQVKHAKRKHKIRKRRRNEHMSREDATVVSVNQDDSSSSDDDEGDIKNVDPRELQTEAVSLQLLSLHDKSIDVLLRLAEHHLKSYFSSSAMQAVRSAARRIATATSLLHPLAAEINRNRNQQLLLRWTYGLQLQFTRLWEYCGHFARSFAADELWRERGHASGDDVVSVLRDVEAAFESYNLSIALSDIKPLYYFSLAHLYSPYSDTLSKKTHGSVSLQDLGAIVDVASSDLRDKDFDHDIPIIAARDFLDGQQQLKRDKRRVLVASCVCYDRAVLLFRKMIEVKRQREQETAEAGGNLPSSSSTENHSKDVSLLNMLRQRLGDACNESGKFLLSELRSLLANYSASSPAKDGDNAPSNIAELAAEPFLSSAEFWFKEGLAAFEDCNDLRNVALLRCNLCQCCKLRANSNFSGITVQKSNNRQGPSSSDRNASHSERCLQRAAEHLQAAHEALGQRDVDAMTWDMVSEELAATLLVLGVRRRQSLLGRSNTPCLVDALRMSPGEERSIVEPMNKALKIYEQSGNAHQAAASHYQLALFYSKVWTCQRDETKTREKLSAAFQHFHSAHSYFSKLQGNEPTFVLLCLDLSNLYAAVSGEECLNRALMCCLDTKDSFSQETIDRLWTTNQITANTRVEWLEKMKTLASSVEERLFKLLRSLVKQEEITPNSKQKPGMYKDMYRVGLTAKMSGAGKSEESDIINSLLTVHKILEEVKTKMAPNEKVLAE